MRRNRCRWWVVLAGMKMHPAAWMMAMGMLGCVAGEPASRSPSPGTTGSDGARPRIELVEHDPASSRFRCPFELQTNDLPAVTADGQLVAFIELSRIGVADPADANIMLVLQAPSGLPATSMLVDWEEMYEETPEPPYIDCQAFRSRLQRNLDASAAQLDAHEWRRLEPLPVWRDFGPLVIDAMTELPEDPWPPNQRPVHAFVGPSQFTLSLPEQPARDLHSRTGNWSVPLDPECDEVFHVTELFGDASTGAALVAATVTGTVDWCGEDILQHAIALPPEAFAAIERHAGAISQMLAAIDPEMSDNLRTSAASSIVPLRWRYGAIHELGL